MSSYFRNNFLFRGCKEPTLFYKSTTLGKVFRWKTIGAKIQNLTSGATKNSPNATKRIIKKAYLEPKLLNFKRCSCVSTKLPLKKILKDVTVCLIFVFLCHVTWRNIKIWDFTWHENSKPIKVLTSRDVPMGVSISQAVLYFKNRQILNTAFCDLSVAPAPTGTDRFTYHHACQSDVLTTAPKLLNR